MNVQQNITVVISSTIRH